jgi:predicted RNA binding protein YcfA (HicA-like mRNA interferase family)
MSKLPLVSGKNCIKVLEQSGFVVYRQRGSHVTLVRENRRIKQPFRFINNWIEER